MADARARLRETAFIAITLLSGAPASADWSWDPQYGTCSTCCSVYPLGWRGMCLHRCFAVRPPRAGYRVMQCECSVNWLGRWTCGR
jgi:hypothetical protein